jgi:hypothetical protein
MNPDSTSYVATSGDLIRQKWRAENPTRVGAPCANCATSLDGPFCTACGQSAEDLQKSARVLLAEAFEHLSDIDGRLLRTLPRLALHPAALTRDYLAGKRASQTSPLRLFLVIVVLFFFAGSLKNFVHPTQFSWIKKDTPTEQMPALTPGKDFVSRGLTAWLNPRMQYAATHRQEFGAAFVSWMHEIPIVFLPIATLLLGLLFVTNRRFVLFDHAVFAMHSLSFMGLLFTTTTLLDASPFSGFSGLLGMAAPVHLFVHFRGVYGTGIWSTLIRLFALFVLSTMAIVILMVVTAALGLGSLGTGAR